MINIKRNLVMVFWMDSCQDVKICMGISSIEDSIANTTSMKINEAIQNCASSTLHLSIVMQRVHIVGRAVGKVQDEGKYFGVPRRHVIIVFSWHVTKLYIRWLHLCLDLDPIRTHEIPYVYISSPIYPSPSPLTFLSPGTPYCPRLFRTGSYYAVQITINAQSGLC